MLIIGLLLILLAVGVIAYVLLATAGMPAVEISYGVLNVEVPPLWLYLAGVLTLAVAAVGLWMAVAGARSRARRAREVRELRKQAKDADRRAVRADDASSLDRRPADAGRSTSTVRPRSAGRPVTGTPGTTAPSAGSGSTRPGAPPATSERNRLEPDR